MHTARKRAGLALLAACLLAALAFGGVAAWAQDSGQGGPNSVTVQVNSATDDDLAQASVAADVYKVGTATKMQGYDAYDYALVDALSSIAGRYNLATMGGAQWQSLADEAAAFTDQLQQVGSSVPADEALEGLEDGLYLVVAPDVQSATAQYSFNPTVVALPTKAPKTDADGNVVVDEDGYPVISSAADYGDWVADAVITLKHAKEPLYGSLRIQKTVNNFSGEPATFVFHLTGTAPDGTAYDNYASIYYTGGTSAETVVAHIPAGTQLTVTEDYTGARYRLVTGDDDTKTIVSDAAVEAGAQMAQASFVNEPNSSGNGGHGINNNFALTRTGESESAWDWVWTAVPAQQENQE